MVELQALLEAQGIPSRLGDLQDEGTVLLSVPRQQRAKARWLAVESGKVQDAEGNFDWLFGDGSPTDSRTRISQRMLESVKRETCDVIRSSDRIRNARIMVQRGPENIFATGPNRADAASVAVELQSGVERLSPREAATIRALVHGAFNILPQQIQISDDRLNNYPYLENGGALGFSDDENRLKNEVVREIQTLYRAMFNPSEFVVAVLVDLSQRRLAIREEAYNEETTLSLRTETDSQTETGTRTAGAPPGVGLNATTQAAQPEQGGERESRTKKVAKYENFPGVRRTETEVPTGELKGIAVNLVLDRNAVLRNLREEGESLPEDPQSQQEKASVDEAIGRYEQRHEEKIQNLLPKSMVNAVATVSTASFPQPAPPETITFSDTFLGWWTRNWKDIGLGVIAVVGLAIFFGIVRRSMPASVEIPTLEERVLLDDDETHRSAVEKLRAAMQEFTKEEATLADEVSQSELEGNLKKVNELSGKRPESVAAVIRTWLSGATASDLASKD
jgi:flagellar biosynthesis/type III secretory pathway M-ring protein FliF/YscJ